MKAIVLLLICLYFVSCDAPQTILKDDQVQFIEKARRSPFKFEVSPDSIDIVWQRAYKFINDYGYTKVQISNDMHLETYTPMKDDYAYVGMTRGFGKLSYKVTKFKVGEKYEVEVNCYSNVPSGDWSRVRDNARLMSHYMLTGEIRPELVISPSNKADFDRVNLVPIKDGNKRNMGK